MRTKELVSIKWKFKGGNKYSTRLSSALRFYDYDDLFHNTVESILTRAADDITDWMKANAPWTDRTGKARASLKAQMGDFWLAGTDYESNYKSSTQVIIGYVATADPVWYAWYLETIQAGKWAIVGPALDEWGPIIWQRVKTALGML